MDSISQFASILKDSSTAPSQELLQDLINKYPWFTLPAAITLARAKNITPESRRELAQYVALGAPDSQTLFRLIDPLGSEQAHFYPPQTADTTPTTDNAINTFLETYGKRDPAEDALLEKLIFNPVAEYAATLQQQDSTPPPAPAPGSQDEILDAFLKDYAPATPPQPKQQKQPVQQPKQQRHKKTHVTPSGDSPLAESLAKVYITRGRYSKAYEIIRKLSLNYPKKSIYFADQLRFLQKLILNSKFIDQ